MAANNIPPFLTGLDEKTQLHEATRRSANYHPSIWGDFFLSFSSPQMDKNTKDLQEDHEQLKQKVRNMLVEDPHISLRKLELINNVQRLGVSYHFEKEVRAILQKTFEVNDDLNAKDIEADDLHAISLRFRLLRQEAYYASTGPFEYFLESDGKFKESMINNVDAMLSLYEASHVRVHGEKILDEALIFTTTHLQTLFTNPKVSEALEQPICKRLARIDARKYISIYQLDESHDAVLLEFAKLDFNLLQRQHQKELGSLTRWWKELDAAEKLPFARDRMVECYLWTLGVYFEPQYGFARDFFLKIISLTSILDDIYDVYGTLEELRLFTNAFQRLYESNANELPEYMKIVYTAFVDAYAEMDKKLVATGESYRINYAKIEMKKLVDAYYEEAKWLYVDGSPTYDQYMRVALQTGAHLMLATTSLVGMQEEFVTKETFDWLSQDPLIVRASAIIGRLKDDIAGHKFEQERGHVDSAVECYIRQYGKSEEEAVRELEEQVTNAWKDINQECLKPTATFPMPILIRVVNLARVIDLVYDADGDSYTHSSKLKSIITSILVDPVL
ncbi:unnamed protein product [Cuscuta epithymum]|uniref:Uncharacterized protein n=1 Tax=Cuscuta epithymum TaxID=186058 RepID=A0AAV0F3E1_9ASTE|nr:unnamed protein product [Cuscuta epithymum]